MAFGAECGTCGYKIKHCKCEKKHANERKAHLPLPTERTRRGRRADRDDHRERCRKQGYRGTSTW